MTKLSRCKEGITIDGVFLINRLVSDLTLALDELVKKTPTLKRSGEVLIYSAWRPNERKLASVLKPGFSCRVFFEPEDSLMVAHLLRNYGLAFSSKRSDPLVSDHFKLYHRVQQGEQFIVASYDLAKKDPDHLAVLVAHEIGHQVLGHLADDAALVADVPKVSLETTADVVASFLVGRQAVVDTMEKTLREMEELAELARIREWHLRDRENLQQNLIAFKFRLNHIKNHFPTEGLFQ